jgi:peptidyl-prolyl cis-trans isomerase D
MTDYLVTPAVVTDEEAREIFRYAREEARADYVLFPPEEYMESVEVEEKDVQAAYEEQRERFTVPAQAEIAYLEFTPEALADPADVTEEEARRAYENNPDAYTRQARVKARHILLRAPDDASGEKAGQAEARLEEIAARIDSAEEFAAAAKEYSEGPSAPSGGDLGWFPRGSMVESFEKAAFDAEPGSLVGPVRTQFGYHLIWVEDRQEAGVLPFEEAELDVRQNVARDKAAGKVTDLLDEAIARVAAGESLEQVAETLEIGLRHAGPFPQNQGPSRPSLSQEAVQRLSTLTPGDTLDEPLSIEGGYALVQLTSQTPSKVRPLEEVRETIVTELKRKEAMVLAEEEAASVAAALHDPQKRERAMERIQDRIKTTEAFTRQGFIPGLGMNERFAAAVFVAEEGDWLDEPYLSERGAFIARLSERTPPTDAEWAEAKQSFIQQLEQSKRQQLYQGFMSELRGEATIEIANKRVLGE